MPPDPNERFLSGVRLGLTILKSLREELKAKGTLNHYTADEVLLMAIDRMSDDLGRCRQEMES